jgi:hypothetical protein
MNLQCNNLQQKCDNQIEGVGLLLASTVERDLAIDNNCREFIALGILELHHLMAAARKLAPSARLLRVLLDGLVFVPVNSKRSSNPPIQTDRVRAEMRLWIIRRT